MSWTDERIDTLRTMWEAGQTASQIAEALGGVSRNAVIGKAHRLGLQARPSPVKANEPAAAPAAEPVVAAPPPPPPAPEPEPVRAAPVVEDEPEAEAAPVREPQPILR
uniref:GcrA family cell cycle regulator n=1 Tax=Sphingomonas sp. GM_Shp_1 TaxID=2937381 RepID=UPI0023DF35A3